MNASREPRRIWDQNQEYGEILFKRAIGDLPEMESAKAIAGMVKELIRPNDLILDVGCGAGHYLRSLRQEITDVPFQYMGIDATASSIKLARKAWSGDHRAKFEVGDVFFARK